ncbi:MAG: hypothetical protein AB8I69_19600 [Anaerolineae bacterium]|jgi:hypothetical protein
MDTIEPASVPKKRAGCWRMTWQRALIALLVAEVTIVELVMMFQEPKAQTVAVSAFVCGLTTMTFRLAIHGARRFWKPPQIHGCLSGLLFVSMGSLGAAWVETVFWAFEKVFAVQGIAAHPNLIVDLLATMPWYVAMVTVLWCVHRRYRYHWTTVALLGVLYEMGGDGILGQILQGGPLDPAYIAQLLFICPGIFLLTYSPMVLPPVWLFPMDDEPYTGPHWQRVAGAFLPLLPLIPYGLIVILLFG